MRKSARMELLGSAFWGELATRFAAGAQKVAPFKEAFAAMRRKGLKAEEDDDDEEGDVDEDGPDAQAGRKQGTP
eukprot:5039297-Alexandrium_andersonii.AAC.1